MSGVRPKGPERPQQRVVQNSREPDPNPRPAATETPPPLTKVPILEGQVPKILMLVSSIVIGIMFILAFSFCLAGGIKYNQPRYFLLLINLILSTGVTGLLIFWYYRHILQPSLLWYVFLQCLILFFQCVTTDIFAWYERPNESHETVTWSTLFNATTPNGSNGSNGSLSQWSF